MSVAHKQRRYITLPTTVQASPGPDAWTRELHLVQQALMVSIREVEIQAPFSSRDSVYVGGSGVALLQYHIASANLEGVAEVLNPERLRKQGDVNLYAVLRRNKTPQVMRNGGHASFLETSVGTATLLLARCIESLAQRQSSEDKDTLKDLWKYWEASVSLLSRTVAKILAEDKDDALFDEDLCEVLYGRAGFLYALLFLRKAVERAKADRSILLLKRDQREQVEQLVDESLSLNRVVDSIIIRGKLGAERYSDAYKLQSSGVGPSPPIPLMWKWHGKSYLGGAHGVFGILQMILSCPKATIESYIPDILLTVKWIIASQDRRGNWPTKAASGRGPSMHELRGQVALQSNELVQWCHGSPGAIILLSTVLRRGSDPHNYFTLSSEFKSRIQGSLRRGADIVYERGLLRKGVGLCHGVGGSVYALLAASSALDSLSDTTHLAKAVHLAHLATFVDNFVMEGQMETPDVPWGLYSGLAGMCSAWSNVLVRISGKGLGLASGMPGYDDIF